MKISVVAVTLLFAVVASVPMTSAFAGMDRNAATKACKKEIGWSSMGGKQKRTPGAVNQLESCIASKAGK